MTLEYLGTAEDTDRKVLRRLPIILGLVVLAVAALAGLGLRWSESVRSTAQLQLEEGLTRSEQLAAAGERSVQGTLAYASPLIWSLSVPEEVRAGLRDLVAASAADAADELLALRDELRGTLVLPWQGPTLEARDEVVALIDSQAQRLARIAQDASNVDRVLADGLIPSGPAQAALARASAG